MRVRQLESDLEESSIVIANYEQVFDEIHRDHVLRLDIPHVLVQAPRVPNAE